MCEGEIQKKKRRQESKGDGAWGWWDASGEIGVQSAVRVEEDETSLTG